MLLSKTITGFIIFWFLISPGLAYAEPPGTRTDIDNAQDELTSIEKQLDKADNSLQASRMVVALRKRIATIRSQSRSCIDSASARISTLTSRREALGEAEIGEDVDVGRLRTELGKEILGSNKGRAACEQLAQVSQELFQRTVDHEQSALKARLFARGIATPGVILNALSDPQAWARVLTGFITQGSGWQLMSMPQRWSVLVAFVLLFLVGVYMRRYWFIQYGRTGKSQYWISALPWLITGTGIGALLITFLPNAPLPPITRVVAGALGWVIVDVIMHIWLAGRKLAGLSERDAKTLTRWVRVLTGLFILGGLFTTAELIAQLPDPHYFLLRTIMAWLLLVGVIWTSVILGRVPDLGVPAILRMVLILVTIVIALAETIGFRHLSEYLLIGFGGTVIGFGFFKYIANFFVFLFDGLDEGQYQWQKSVRKWMGLKSQELVPGLIWLRLAASLLTWLLFAIWTLWVWGQSERWVNQIIEYVQVGFDIGSLHIAPIQILGAIAVLAVGINLTRWFKQHVITDIVKRTRLDRGGKEAVITVSGYVGVTITILIALGIAGISYTNIAIVAGALSVGIGFGLQNVVNNFVSGLILLFERPVRTGDWIVVGDTQGFVRKISIRSTQIETFDRLDIIVPNSELISNKVSNWMLRDPWGRITVAVGVAYGSDIDKVIQILVSVANAHEGVLVDQAGLPPPKALFMRFGDSALEFELRCFIRQIDKMFDVKSDLNIAIDRAFREAGITIPFPQRDVHVKDLPQKE